MFYQANGDFAIRETSKLGTTVHVEKDLLVGNFINAGWEGEGKSNLVYVFGDKERPAPFLESRRVSNTENHLIVTTTTDADSDTVIEYISKDDPQIVALQNQAKQVLLQHMKYVVLTNEGYTNVQSLSTWLGLIEALKDHRPEYQVPIELEDLDLLKEMYYQYFEYLQRAFQQTGDKYIDSPVNHQKMIDLIRADLQASGVAEVASPQARTQKEVNVDALVTQVLDSQSEEEVVAALKLSETLPITDRIKFLTTVMRLNVLPTMVLVINGIRALIPEHQVTLRQEAGQEISQFADGLSHLDLSVAGLYRNTVKLIDMDPEKLKGATALLRRILGKISDNQNFNYPFLEARGGIVKGAQGNKIEETARQLGLDSPYIREAEVLYTIFVSDLVYKENNNLTMEAHIIGKPSGDFLQQFLSFLNNLNPNPAMNASTSRSKKSLWAALIASGMALVGFQLLKGDSIDRPDTPSKMPAVNPQGLPVENINLSNDTISFNLSNGTLAGPYTRQDLEKMLLSTMSDLRSDLPIHSRDRLALQPDVEKLLAGYEALVLQTLSDEEILKIPFGGMIRSNYWYVPIQQNIFQTVLNIMEARGAKVKGLISQMADTLKNESRQMSSTDVEIFGKFFMAVIAKNKQKAFLSNAEVKDVLQLLAILDSFYKNQEKKKAAHDMDVNTAVALWKKFAPQHMDLSNNITFMIENIGKWKEVEGASGVFVGQDYNDGERMIMEFAKFVYQELVVKKGLQQQWKDQVKNSLIDKDPFKLDQEALYLFQEDYMSIVTTGRAVDIHWHGFGYSAENTIPARTAFFNEHIFKGQVPQTYSISDMTRQIEVLTDQINGTKTPRLLRPGDKFDASALKSGNFIKLKTDDKAQITDKTSSIYVTNTYGESLGSVAADLELSIDDLLRLNPGYRKTETWRAGSYIKIEYTQDSKWSDRLRVGGLYVRLERIQNKAKAKKEKVPEIEALLLDLNLLSRIVFRIEEYDRLTNLNDRTRKREPEKHQDKIKGIEAELMGVLTKHQSTITTYGLDQDAAMNSTINRLPGQDRQGGIDFNAANLNLQIKRDGKGVPLPINQQNLENIHLDGLIPEILDIRPAMNSPLLAELTSAQPQVLAKT